MDSDSDYTMLVDLVEGIHDAMLPNWTALPELCLMVREPERFAIASLGVPEVDWLMSDVDDVMDRTEPYGSADDVWRQDFVGMLITHVAPMVMVKLDSDPDDTVWGFTSARTGRKGPRRLVRSTIGVLVDGDCAIALSAYGHEEKVLTRERTARGAEMYKGTVYKALLRLALRTRGHLDAVSVQTGQS